MSRVGVLMLWLAAGTAVGCVGQPGAEVDTSMTAQAVADDCDSDGICPTNSPVIATYPFHELYAIPNQQQNRQHFMIDHFSIAGTDYNVRVLNGKIYGFNATGTVSGSAIEGSQLWLTRDGVNYIIRIDRVVKVKMWARRDPSRPPPEIEAYEMQWIEVTPGPNLQWKNVCADARRPAHTDDLSAPWSTVPDNVVFVFEGDRIDPATKTVYDWDQRWFNLGCAGHTLAKMYLMGHVGAASVMGYVTTRDERQTIMKMFSGDYCGTGYAFTVPGIPLLWRDHKGWFPYVSAVSSIEARWTPSGVACLTVPRTMANGNADSEAKWPAGVIPEIQARCAWVLSPNASCRNPPEGLFGAHLVTANPVP